MVSSSYDKMTLRNAMSSQYTTDANTRIDHGKDGSGPMIWLDGLDIPSYVHFPVHFVEHYKDPRYPADLVDKEESPIVFPWTHMKKNLDTAGGDWATRPYLEADGNESKLSKFRRQPHAELTLFSKLAKHWEGRQNA